MVRRFPSLVLRLEEPTVLRKVSRFGHTFLSLQDGFLAFGDIRPPAKATLRPRTAGRPRYEGETAHTAARPAVWGLGGVALTAVSLAGGAELVMALGRAA